MQVSLSLFLSSFHSVFVSLSPCPCPLTSLSFSPSLSLTLLLLVCVGWFGRLSAVPGVLQYKRPAERSGYRR